MHKERNLSKEPQRPEEPHRAENRPGAWVKLLKLL